MTLTVIIILIGLVAGIFSGLIGVGGVIVIVPSLIFCPECINMKHREPASPSCCPHRPACRLQLL